MDVDQSVAANHLAQAKHLYQKGQYTQAIKHLTRSISENGKNWEVYYYLGLCEQKTGRFDRSIGSFNNSLKYCTAPGSTISNIYLALGVSWEHEGYLYKAGDTYAVALRLNPTLIEAETGIKRIEAKVAKAEAEKKNKKDAQAF